MRGKYNSRLKFHGKQFTRSFLRAALLTMQRWRPLTNPADGYTIIVGNYAPLAEILLANFRLLARQDLTHLRKIIVVSDRPRRRMPVPIEEMARQQFPQLPLEFLYYSEVEYRFFKAIGWSYTYCWKSWTDAIAACETRYALIHDMDAFLLRPDVFEERYRFIREGGHQYVGVNTYHFNGIEREDNLVTTWELMFDVAFVREHFRPLDLFNHVCMYKGRAVEFDCFLYAQSQRGSNVVLPIRKADMVHPTQTITQYTDLINVKGYVPPAANNLLMIPYFYYLADRPEEMTDLTEQLRSSRGPVYRLFDHAMDLSRLSREHVEWITTQAYTLESAVYRHMREPVKRYFEAIRAFADCRDAARSAAPAQAPTAAGWWKESESAA